LSVLDPAVIHILHKNALTVSLPDLKNSTLTVSLPDLKNSTIFGEGG